MADTWQELAAEKKHLTGVMFTQYLLPDGRKEEQWMVDPQGIPADVWAATVGLYDKVTFAGYRFEMELLSDYRTVSLTCAGHHQDIGEDNDIVHSIAANGPGIPDKVVALIQKAYEQLVAWNIIGEEPD